MQKNFKKVFFQKEVFGQIAAIFFIQASSTTAYAVFYSGLSIYLTQHKLFSQELAATITGLFLSLNYCLPLIGGVLANRIISYKTLYLLGTLLSLTGCLLLAYSGYLYISLALFLMGSLVNVCLNMFLTQLFSLEQKTERRIAFIWNYIGMNLGFMLGYFFTGFSVISNSYFYLFIAMSILVLISLTLASLFIKEPKFNSKINKPVTFQIATCLFIISCLIIIIDMFFYYASILHNSILLSTFLIISLIMFYALKKSRTEEKKNLHKFMFFSILAIVFWTFYMLTPIAMMQIIEHAVQRKVLGINLAPQWIVNIDSLIILMFAPILATILRKNKMFFNNSYNYFVTGFLFSGCGFLFLFAGIYFIFEAYMPLPFMLGYLISITIGEIFISPASNALIGELIQEPLRGLMTGAWGMNICIGGLLASSIANKFILPYLNINGFTTSSSVTLQHVFLSIGGFLIFLAAIILIKFNIRRKRLEYAYENK